MSLSTHHIPDLLFRSLEGSLEEKERRALQEWLDASAHHQDLYADLHSEERLREQLLAFRPEEQAAVNQRILNLINDELFVTPAIHRIHFLKTVWFRYAAAIIIIFGIGAYLWNKQNGSHTITQAQPVPLEKNVLPGGQKAMLTLADGRTIVLDSAADGWLAVEPGSAVIKRNGEVIYDTQAYDETDEGGPHHGGKVMMNTMSTPKGGQYQLVLSDGTRVWLNAESSVIYPAVFTGTSREISVVGEVYCEVAENAALPFKVKIGEAIIEVLGTNFNINAYKDEPVVKTTLLEGAVKVVKGNNRQILKPGQQAQFNSESNAINLVNNADADEAIAWKNGTFDFRDQDIETVMRQIGRWYNMDIVYEGKKPNVRILSMLNRNTDLATVLESLELIGLRFRIETSLTKERAGKIIVQP